MTDPVPDTKPSTRWFWVLILVGLAVALVIFVLNADGDEEIEEIPDSAITTTEERLNTDLGLEDDSDAAEQVNGLEPAPAPATAPATAPVGEPLAEPAVEPAPPVTETPE